MTRPWVVALACAIGVAVGLQSADRHQGVAAGGEAPGAAAPAVPPVAPPRIVPIPRPAPPALRGARSEADLAGVIARSAELIARAREGDAQSAIGLLSAIDRCHPLPADEPAPLEACAALPPALVANRLEILEAAVARGSAEAQLSYARTMVAVGRFDPYAMGSELNDAPAVGRLAEWYALAAARQGLNEAYGFLAEASVDGSFGVRDEAKARAYRLALHR